MTIVCSSCGNLSDEAWDGPHSPDAYLCESCYEKTKASTATIVDEVETIAADAADLPTPPPPPRYSAEVVQMQLDRDHWRTEHAAEHALRLELEQKLERAERNWQNFMMKLATIVDFIEVDANEFYGSHAERTGATKLWRAMLNNLLNRYALATPPQPTRQDFTPPTPDEEIPF